MKQLRHPLVIMFTLVIGLTACNKFSESSPIPDSELNNTAKCKEALIDIKFTEDLTEAELRDFVSSTGILSLEKLFPDGGEYQERHRREGLHLWYKARYNPEIMTATKAEKELASFPGVALVETPPEISITSTNDPDFGQQWHLFQHSGIDINVEEVWRSYTTGSQQIVVAVVDRGIDTGHPDLSANCIPGGNGKSFNFVTDSYTITGEEHGTHVGGIISSIRNNGIGIAGIAGGDATKGQGGVRLLSCIIMGKDTQGKDVSAEPAPAITYAADNGALICQNSWGYPADLNKDGKISSEELERIKNMDTPASLKAAIDYFVKYAGCDNDGNQLPDSPMKGGLVFFSAGNENIQYGQPAMYENVIAVGSITSDGEKSSFSNYGSWVDICAPGSNIYSTVPGGYRYLSGTSMACPMVSGVAALVLSYRGGYGFTNEDLKSCLLGGASYSKISTGTVGPLVDALGAVSYGIENPPAAIESFNTEVRSNNVTVSWKVPDRGNGKGAYGASVYYSTDRSAIEALDPLHPSSSILSVTTVTSSLEIGETASCTVSDLQFEKEYYFRIASCNPGASYAEPSKVSVVTTGSNNAPVISSNVSLEDIRLRSKQIFSFTLSVSDPDGHNFSYEYLPGSDAESVMSSEAQTKVSILGSKAKAGVYTAKLIAKDIYGMASSLEIHYRILENEAPVVEAKFEDVFIYTRSGTLEIPLADYFSDPDGDDLTFSANSTPAGIATISTDTENIYITAQKEGVCQVKVMASDPRRTYAEQEFRVIVRTKGESVSVYPTSVRDILYIAGDASTRNLSICIVSSGSGAVVFEEELSASAFEPAAIDLSAIAPGRYLVEIKTEGNLVTRKTIIKR